MINQVLLNRFYLMLFCLLFVCNNNFAVKPVHHPTQQMEAASIEDLANTSIKDLENQSGKKFKLKEKIALKILQRKLKKDSHQIYSDTSSVGALLINSTTDTYRFVRINEGQMIEVRTKGLITYKGKLEIIDDERIAVDGQVISLKGIAAISLKRWAGQTIIGFVLLSLSILVLIFAIILGGSSDRQEYVLGLIFLIPVSGILFLISLITLAFKKVFKPNKYDFTTRKEQDDQ